MHNILRFVTLLSAIVLVGCGTGERTIKPFKMEIQQGNVVTSEMLLKLRPGMTKSQVQFIMGTPLLVDSFHTNRWDYFYQLRKQGEIINQRRVILDFDGDALAKVRGDVVPEGTDIDALMQQAGSEAKASNQVSETTSEMVDKAKLITTPIEMPEIQSAVVVPEKEIEALTESAPLAAVPNDAQSVRAMSAAPVTAQEIVKPEPAIEAVAKKEAVPVVEKVEVLTPPVFEMESARVEALPVVAVPAVEAAAVQETVAEPVITTEPALVQSMEEMVEPAKAQMESKVNAEKIEAIAPPVVKSEQKVVKTRGTKIPAPPVVDSWSKTSAKPTQTKITAPPVMGSSAKSVANHSSPATQKAVDDTLANEEDPGLFERTLEMIGF